MLLFPPESSSPPENCPPVILLAQNSKVVNIRTAWSSYQCGNVHYISDQSYASSEATAPVKLTARKLSPYRQKMQRICFYLNMLGWENLIDGSTVPLRATPTPPSPPPAQPTLRKHNPEDNFKLHPSFLFLLISLSCGGLVRLRALSSPHVHVQDSSRVSV